MATSRWVFLFMLLSQIEPAESSTQASVNRPHFGVYFRFHAESRLKLDYWSHLFEITIPLALRDGLLYRESNVERSTL